MVNREEIIILMIPWIVFSFLGYYLWGAIGSIVVFVLTTFIGLCLIRWRRSNKIIGVTRLPSFSVHMFDDKGLLASFKIDDAWLMDQPSELTVERIKIKKYNLEKEDFELESETIDVDYLEQYDAILEEFLKQMIPDPVNIKEPKYSLDQIMKNVRNVQIATLYSSMSKEEKDKFVSVSRAILGLHFGLSHPPKVYKICSLQNQIYINFFAFDIPTAYMTYSKVQWFKKWDIIPIPHLGSPVVELWGKETPLAKEVEGIICRNLISMPLQDEKYRQEKFLNIKKYGMAMNAHMMYVEKILDVLPTITVMRLVMAERDKYQEENAILMQGIQDIVAKVGGISSMLTASWDMLSRVSGNMSRIKGQLPEPIQKMLEEALPSPQAIEKGKTSALGMLGGMKNTLQRAITGVEDKEKQPLPQPQQQQQESSEQK